MTAPELSYYPQTQEMSRDISRLAQPKEDTIRDFGALALSSFTAGIVEPVRLTHEAYTAPEKQPTTELVRALGAPALQSLVQKESFTQQALTEQAILGRA